MRWQGRPAARAALDRPHPFGRAAQARPCQAEPEPTRVGAAFDRDVGPSDLDGRCFRLLITDQRGVEWVLALLPRMDRNAPVDPEQVERAVEQRAGSYATEDRLRLLQVKGELTFPEGLPEHFPPPRVSTFT